MEQELTNGTVDALVEQMLLDPYGYSEQTSIADLFKDERCRDFYNQYFEEIYPLRMYNDLFGYTPDYPSGKALRERIPTGHDQDISAFYEAVSGLDLGKVK